MKRLLEIAVILLFVLFLCMTGETPWMVQGSFLLAGLLALAAIALCQNGK